ncbi:hypothetical protein EI42_03109 [Thermosporothrix hazakensis]|jgi:hypothetical protein|uniref:DUF7715 domain-containing protein n=1 Tax=Thermosporothrix hazakensis TaxID=644383 RepID=A0A326UEA6_THEHA|nr:hypothetical protein [Thermosporothrix hazakensis]PZW28355.1 hypothetical protein EI42_03109 [Thermosporothrix hazakensis]
MSRTPILLATRLSQGMRPSDCCDALPGEPVDLPLNDCDPDERTFVGLISGQRTTTVHVAAVPAGEEHLRFWLRCYWTQHLTGLTTAAFEEFLDESCAELLRIAASVPLGTILERRGNQLCTREPIEPFR